VTAGVRIPESNDIFYSPQLRVGRGARGFPFTHYVLMEKQTSQDFPARQPPLPKLPHIPEHARAAPLVTQRVHFSFRAKISCTNAYDSV